MNKQLRNKILDEIMNDVSKNNGEVSQEAIKLINAFFNCISEDIGEAIGIINDLNAPFIVASLETYAENVRDNFPEAKKVIDEIKNLPCMVTIKRKSEKL